MYPYNFSGDKFIDGTKIFVAMPFANQRGELEIEFFSKEGEICPPTLSHPLETVA